MFFFWGGIKLTGITNLLQGIGMMETYTCTDNTFQIE